MDDAPLAIPWRDARFVVVDKPSGIAVHRGWAAGGDDDVPLLQRVRDQLDAYVWLINRLDRGASGAVLFALDAEAARAESSPPPTRRCWPPSLRLIRRTG